MSFNRTKVRNTKAGIETVVTRVDQTTFETRLTTESGHEIVMEKFYPNPVETQDWEWFCEHESSPLYREWLSFGQ